MPYDNKDEVGAIWRAVIQSGPHAGEEYLDVKLELAKLIELVGQEEVVRISAFSVTSEHPKAPLYRLKVRPAGGAGASPQRRPARATQPPLLDDDVPF